MGTGIYDNSFFIYDVESFRNFCDNILNLFFDSEIFSLPHNSQNFPSYTL